MTKHTNHLDVNRVIKEFDKSEHSETHRRGTFKIEAPFDKALNTVLKSKAPKKSKRPN